MPQNIPDHLWQKVDIGLFEFDSIKYLATVDYFSNFWEIVQLLSAHWRHTLQDMGFHVNWFPTQAHSFSSFKNFSEKWDFEHLMASPGNQQANSKVESAVKSAKRLMKKNKDTHMDQFLALLDMESTPSQQLLNCRTCTLLPIRSYLLNLRMASLDKILLEHRQKIQAKYYDLHTCDLPVLSKGDVVWMCPYKKGDWVWEKGIIKHRLDERSYEVQTVWNLLVKQTSFAQIFWTSRACE